MMDSSSAMMAIKASPWSSMTLSTTRTPYPHASLLRRDVQGVGVFGSHGNSCIHEEPMENFARLFILQMDLQDPPRKGRGETPTPREKWHSVDRLVALYGPPDVINHAWVASNRESEQDWEAP